VRFSSIRDPIHQTIRIPTNLRAVLDSEPVQRLRRINQLNFCHYVYPGANHTRFEHSLGVMYLAQRVCDRLRESTDALSDAEVQAVVLGALLHDIGHGPFSHTFEPLLQEHVGKGHEEITRWLVQESEVAPLLEAIDQSPAFIASLTAGDLASLGQSRHLGQLLASSINVDSMDYLMRDSHHCGASFGLIDIDRLIFAFGLCPDGGLGYNKKALVAIENFFMARIACFKTIYFHKACRAVQLMVTEAMQQANRDLHFVEYASCEEFLRWDDYVLWTKLLEHPGAAAIMNRIKRRDFVKMVYENTQPPGENRPDVFRREIAQDAGLPEAEVFVDHATSTTLPYSHQPDFDPASIPMIEEDAGGGTFQSRLGDHSDLVNFLGGNIRFFRVYARREHREQVARAAQRVINTIDE
jgi:HD superfamily phosphohydrolase